MATRRYKGKKINIVIVVSPVQKVKIVKNRALPQ